MSTLTDMVEEIGAAETYEALFKGLDDADKMIQDIRIAVVASCRQDKIPWSMIGGWLHVTGQAAQQKYGKAKT